MVRFYKLILLKNQYLVYKMDAMEVYQKMHLNLYLKREYFLGIDCLMLMDKQAWTDQIVDKGALDNFQEQAEFM